MADLLARPLSVHFSTRYMRRLNHSDVIEALKCNVDVSKILAVQITEKKCIITMADESIKTAIILNGLHLEDRFVPVTDVDAIITNVTLKDAPFEMSDMLLIEQMSQFGDIISGSVIRGKIKNTEIENGTRYMKILSCVPILPNDLDIGRFTIRLFADNNRTKCKICGDVTHPFYRCPTRNMNHASGDNYGNNGTFTAQKSCWNCNETGHVKLNCPRGVICRACQKEGHIQADCPTSLYGEYAAEILEGQRGDEVTNKDDDSTYEDADSTTPTEMDNEPLVNNDANKNTVKRKVKLILGDSNGVRLRVKDNNVRNISLSGQSLKSVESLMAKAVCESDEYVESAAIHLGTNDLTKTDKNSTLGLAIKTMHMVSEKWPDTPVAFSSILPRSVKSMHVKSINSNAQFVNAEILNLCKTKPKFHFIDNDVLFLENGKIKKTMYDARNPSGVHISDEGADELYSNLISFLIEGESDELLDITFTPMRKRGRSEGSPTPPSISRKPKLGKKGDLPKDCLEIIEHPEKFTNKGDGVYKIRTWRSQTVLKVFCNMSFEQGGWTVLQKRDVNNFPVLDFNRNFNEYEYGFGNPSSEYWLGLQYASELSSSVNDNNVSAEYINSDGSVQRFALENVTLKDGPGYNVVQYFNSVSGPQTFTSNRFYTYDRDSTFKCAAAEDGGWWLKDDYSHCFSNNTFASLEGLTLADILDYFNYNGWIVSHPHNYYMYVYNLNTLDENNLTTISTYLMFKRM